MNEKSSRSNGPDREPNGEKSLTELFENPAFSALTDTDRLYLGIQVKRDPSLGIRMNEIALMLDQVEQQSALARFRIKIGGEQKDAVQAFLSKTKRFTKEQKEFLLHNLDYSVFWNLLVNAAMHEMYTGKEGTDLERSRENTIQSIRIFIKQYGSMQAFTKHPDLNEAAFMKFNSLLYPAVERLSTAQDLDQALTWMATDVVLKEIIEAAQRLPKEDLKHLLNRLYEDADFSSVKTGIYRLRNYLFPTWK